MWTKRDKDELIEEIRALKIEVGNLHSEREAAEEAVILSEDMINLRRQIVDLHIEKDREIEQRDKQVREVKHLVGLEKKRGEFEIEAAKRDTTLIVREGNLQADQKRFAEEMKFQRGRFEEEVGYLKDLMGQILDRLPTVTIDRSVSSGARAPRARTAK